MCTSAHVKSIFYGANLQITCIKWIISKQYPTQIRQNYCPPTKKNLIFSCFFQKSRIFAV